MLKINLYVTLIWYPVWLFDTIKRVNLEHTIDDIINRRPVLMRPEFQKILSNAI